ncbi:MAG TPA: hypothetical protein VF530_22120 [Planctomycetota bacterium]
MSVSARVLLVILGGLLVASVAAGLLGFTWAKWLAAPTLFIAGWAAIGHLVTLDDDAPGGWSNPDGSTSFWRRSVVQLLLKFALFGVSLWVFMAEWTP